jgi:hypothetical protein
MPPNELDIALENDLVFALFWAGKSDEALERARSTAEGAAAAGDRVGELCGNILEWSLRFHLEPHGATERLDVILERALPVFNAAGDDRALYIGYSSLGLVASIRAQMDASRRCWPNSAGTSQIAAGELRSERRWVSRRSSSSSWPAILPPRPKMERKLADCSTSRGKSRFSRPRPGGWRRRCTRSTGSTRPTLGRSAPRSSARARTR